MNAATERWEEPCRILLIDDHPMLRRGTLRVLNAHDPFSVVGEAESGEQGLRLYEKLRPDVVVLDLHLPDMSGMEVLRRVRSLDPHARVMVFSVHEEPEFVVEAVDCGALGFVVKTASPDTLQEAVWTLFRGEAYFCPVAMQALEDGRARMDEGPPVLSPREREVLVLVARGLTNKQVASELEISVRTVETHRERLMKKLDIRNVAGLTRYAIATGMLRQGPRSDD